MRDLLNQEAEFVIDVAEDNIDTDIVTHKNIDSSKWKLLNSVRGKKRGYAPKQELDHTGKIGPITFNLIEKSIEEIKDAKIRSKSDS